MNATDAILHGLRGSRDFIAAATADLSAEEMLYRPEGGGNCTAHVLGHLTGLERRVLGGMGSGDLPEVQAGYLERFGPGQAAGDESAVGANPDRLRDLFAEHRALTMRMVRGIDPEKLNLPFTQPIQTPFPLFGTVGELLNFLGLHTMLHAGQITLVRRSLGRPPMF